MPVRPAFCFLLTCLMLAACADKAANPPADRINTTFYPLGSATTQVPEQPYAPGGGLTLFGSGYLLVTGDGDMYRYDGRQTFTSLAVKAPLNRDEFKAAVSARKLGSRVNLQRFRVGDVISQGERIYVAHHFWKENCFVVRVSVLQGVPDTANAQWQTLFDSSPCIELQPPESGNVFKGQHQGGRLALLDNKTLLLSLGDHGFDGLNQPDDFPQSAGHDYGKVIAINLTDKTSRVFTSGHRAPSGLFVDKDGNVWLAEHGPQGGDEINLLREGANYGWPLVSYGVDYGTYEWPRSPRQNSHQGFADPQFAFVPSVALTDVIRLTGAAFPIWQGDLIAASLKSGNLYRMPLADNRVIAAEPIAVGARIRDLTEGHEGELLLWTDDGRVIRLYPAQVTRTR